MEKTLKITLGFFETYGTGTLIGVLPLSNDECLADLKKLHLVFEETPLSWRRDNGGPHLSIIPEYVHYCFLEDILRLVGRGVEITYSTELKSPPH